MKLFKKLANLLVESYAPDAAREATIRELLRLNAELREAQLRQLADTRLVVDRREKELGECKLELSIATHRAKDAETMRDAYGAELDRIKCRRTVVLTAPFEQRWKYDPAALREIASLQAQLAAHDAPSGPPTRSST